MLVGCVHAPPKGCISARPKKGELSKKFALGSKNRGGIIYVGHRLSNEFLQSFDRLHSAMNLFMRRVLGPGWTKMFIAFTGSESEELPISRQAAIELAKCSNDIRKERGE